MNLLCNWLGHKFKHYKLGRRIPVSCCYGSSSNVTDSYEGLQVEKKCERCGFMSADTFEISGTRMRML